MIIECPLTGSTNVKVLYKQTSVPLLQNRVYPTKERATEAACIDVTLAQSLDNGFVFSAFFDETIITYDGNYQNEQSNSLFFQQHLEDVISIMTANNLLEGKVVEVGCGKAFFLDLLLNKGVDITGFDPTYEGDSPRVVKDFFSDRYSDIEADSLILRHTLEHIPKPFAFLKTLAAANNYKGKIYIEVPTFEWILKENAIEDIFYEHCNYFTLGTLQMLFTKSVGGHFFNGQYIYVIADLADLKNSLEKKTVQPFEVHFNKKLKEYKTKLDNLESVAIWGAGAKGSTFLNLVDKKREKVKAVIDINKRKQYQYIGGTGHQVTPPSQIDNEGIKNIIVMNHNYLEEIRTMTGNNINLLTL